MAIPMIQRILLILAYLCSTVTCQKATSVIWNKHQEEFIDLYSISSFAAFQRKTSSDNSEQKRNILDKYAQIQGETFRASYFEEKNIVSFYDNDTKITGVYGEVWNTLADYLNFTLVPVKCPENTIGVTLDNGSYTGVLGMFERNETDIVLRTGYYIFRIDRLEFTMPLWQAGFEVFTKPHYKYDNKWIISMFTPITWCSILFLFFVLCIVGYVLQTISEGNNYFKEPEEHLSINDHIFYTHAMMCVQGSLPHSFTDKFKILFISKIIFTWLIVLSLNANLINRMTNRNAIIPFARIPELLNNTDYDIMLTNTSKIYGTFKKMFDTPKYTKRKTRIYYFSSTVEMYEQLCESKTLYAMFEVRDKVLAHPHLCTLITVNRPYYVSWVGFGISKNFKYKEIINSSIIKMHEIGLVAALKKRWLKNPEDYHSAESYIIIDLDQVLLILFIPCCGTVLSVVILFIENVVFFWNMKHK